AVADARLPGMRNVFRRAAFAFSERPPVAATQGMPARFVLQLLSLAYEPRRQERARLAVGKPDCQRNQLFSQSAAAGFAAKERARGDSAPQARASRLDAACMERRMFVGTRAVLGRDSDL